MTTKTDIIIFCKSIKNIRIINKMSKRQFAKMLHISEKSLSMIENGKMPPRLSTSVIMDIYDCFGIIPKKLFNGDML